MHRAEQYRDSEKNKKHTSNVLYEGKRLSLFIETVEDEPEIQRSYEIVNHINAVVILALNTENRIYFIRQWRRAVQEVLIELPAGCIEDGEAADICAQRELREEIGFAAQSLTPLGMVYPAPGFSTQKLWIFLAQNLTHSPMVAEDSPHIDTVTYSLQEALELVDKGIIKDAKTLCALLYWMRLKTL